MQLIGQTTSEFGLWKIKTNHSFTSSQKWIITFRSKWWTKTDISRFHHSKLYKKKDETEQDDPMLISIFGISNPLKIKKLPSKSLKATLPK